MDAGTANIRRMSIFCHLAEARHALGHSAFLPPKLLTLKVIRAILDKLCQMACNALVAVFFRTEGWRGKSGFEVSGGRLGP